jgi:hypothetical protein
VEAAPPIQARRIRLELAAGLDAWAFVRETARKPGDTTWKDLLALARAVDPDEWRTRLRNALEARDQKALKNRHFSLNANA